MIRAELTVLNRVIAVGILSLQNLETTGGILHAKLSVKLSILTSMLTLGDT